MHDYPVTVQWNGGRDGQGRFTAKHSGSTLPIAVPPEFQGPGGGASPEELLTSAIVSCYTVTFGIIAANRKIPLEDVHVEAVGEVEQNGPSFKYVAIAIRPRIVLAREATEEQMKLADEMAHKADSYCIVTNAVRASVKITVEPEVRRG